MKPALLVLGGITYKNYALGDLLKQPEANQYINGNSISDNTKYSFIKELDCEQFIDSRLMQSKTIDILSKFFLLGVPIRLWDRLADYFKIIANAEIVKRCTEYVEHEIILANKIYGEVDVIAHSMGTLILLSSQVKVRNLYLLGSPLTSKFFTIRKTANNFLLHKKINCSSQNTYYCFSANDIVGNTSFKLDGINNINCYPSKHAFTDYLRYCLGNKIITLN